MQNPFESIMQELTDLRKEFVEIRIELARNNTKIEIIDRIELRKRLEITEPTAITWGKRGIIPELRIGSNVRYNWPEVVKALESKKYR